jgi:tetratricopeptide (TPR) repeat protein
MPVQVNSRPIPVLISILLLVLHSTVLAGSNADDLFDRGEFLAALKAYQAETTAELAILGKVPPKQDWADSATWDVDSRSGLKSLCLFEKGFGAWVKGDSDTAVQKWVESQKEALAAPLEKRCYFRRTQLAILAVQWGQIQGVPQKAEALAKAAADVQALPLPENATVFSQQIEAEQMIAAMAAYMRLNSKVGEANFPNLLLETAREIRKDQQVGQLLCSRRGKEEPNYDAVVDRLLFQPLPDQLWPFLDQYLAAQPQNTALAGNVKGARELLQVFASLEAPKPDVFVKRLGKWVEGQPEANIQLVNSVLCELLRSATESNQPDYMDWVVKGVGPYLAKVSWPNDAFCSRVAQLFRSRGDNARAASLMAPIVAKATDPQSQAQGLAALMEVKLKAGDSAGALEDGKKAIAVLEKEKKVPARLHRLMATACINLKKYPEAVTYLQNYLEIAGKTAETVEAQYLIGWLYCLDKKFNEARTQFQSVVDACPNSPYAKKSRDFLRDLPAAKKN